jgi:hypothetical protein
MDKTISGSCLCGGVQYEVAGPMRDVVACHCEQCRRTSGHFVAASRTDLEDFTLVKDDTLTWYQSSDDAKRGFCQYCGGNLFWLPEDGGTISIYAGTLDPPTNLATAAHIFTDFKGDYYDIPPDAPRFPKYD